MAVASLAKSTSYGLQWNADKIHTLRWTHGAVRGFEDSVRDLLGIQKTEIVSARSILGGPHIHNNTILSLAVAYALRHESPDQKTVMSLDEVDELIDAAVLKGESIEDLKLKLFESFLMATDPSSVVSWKENSKNSREKQEQVTKMLMEIERLQADQKIREAEGLLRKLTFGQKPSGSEESNSA